MTLLAGYHGHTDETGFVPTIATRHHIREENLMRTLTISTAMLSAFLLVGASASVFAQSDENKGTKYTIKHKTKQMGQATADKALVYILRPAFVGIAIKMWAFVDDQFIGVTHGKNYTYALVAPGEHVFWSKAENVSAFKMNVEAGKTYYLQQKVRPGGFRAHVKFAEAEDSKVKKYFKKSKYVTPTEQAHAKAQEYIEKWYALAQERAEERADKE